MSALTEVDVRRIIRDEIAAMGRESNDGRSILDLVNASIEREHGDVERGHDLAGFRDSTSRVLGVATVQPCRCDIERVAKVSRDLAHGSPLNNAPTVGGAL